ncbi:MAG: hypothetical protein J6Q22_11320 [Prevotella sp.]|nr:hypothetical protein [Prevotella sp.]
MNTANTKQTKKPSVSPCSMTTGKRKRLSTKITTCPCTLTTENGLA